MKQSAIIVLVYGILVLAGGIIGHYKAASTASLVSGIVFGALLMGTSWIIIKKKLVGIYSALAITLILDCFFTYRLALTHKFMPSGMMCIMSLAVVIALTYFLRKDSKKQTIKI